MAAVMLLSSLVYIYILHSYIMIHMLYVDGINIIKYFFLTYLKYF